MLNIILIAFSLGLAAAQAGTTAPDCLDNKGKALPVIDQQVIQWKSTTANQFLARARVQGVVSDIFPDHNGHTHFAIILSANPKDNLEIIYNQSFGALPHIAVGMNVEACGDYITSDAATTQYPASPAGAILHWIHRNPSSHGHASGYLMINGALYGQGPGSGGG
ncbi:MAG: DUF3465 domain-containing protein [Bdellovibrionales bacterium]|nr:DUF3465 domain-containing protein [Oligoflexia bacterium]